jgi:amino acid transporter
VAASIGGAWLGHAVAAGAVVSTAGLFMALLLTNSRIPYVLARDGAFPRAFAIVHPRYGTPWAAVLTSAAIYSACAVFSFKELIVLNVWLYSLTLLVELAAFLALRARVPELPRPWRVPGGWPGAIAVTALPSLFAAAAMATAGWANTGAGVLAALSGPLVWALTRRFSSMTVARSGSVASE